MLPPSSLMGRVPVEMFSFGEGGRSSVFGDVQRVQTCGFDSHHRAR